MSLSTMELSGAVVKQGYLAKQVWLPLSKEDGQSLHSGEAEKSLEGGRG
jgi:hypothetical protein